ncbi:plasmid replication, integration and excision activator [Streptosporangium lutulentum]
MALQGPIPVTFDMVFPHGCYIVGEVEPVKDFDASTNGRFVQSRDKSTGEPMWQVAVMDADPTVKPGQKTVAVKILTPVQPVPRPDAGPALHPGRVRPHHRHPLRQRHWTPGLLHQGPRDARPRTGSGAAPAKTPATAGKDVA